MGRDRPFWRTTLGSWRQRRAGRHRLGAREIFNMVVVDGNIAINHVGGQRRLAAQAVVCSL